MRQLNRHITIFRSMIWFFIFITGWFLYTSIVMMYNIKYLRKVTGFKKYSIEEKSLSICIPARNEEKNLQTLLPALINLAYKNFEILVYDDASSDASADILTQYSARYPGLIKVVSTKKKPEKWLGKTWACHCLHQEAIGNFLVFIDADTLPGSHFCSDINQILHEEKPDAFSVWPHQKFETFWEQTVIPLIYFAWYSLLPARWNEQLPDAVPKKFRDSLTPYFTASCGQCMVFSKKCYEKIGGHRSVKSEIVEDMEIAKNVRKSGLKFQIYNGLNSISCRMYTSHTSIFQGFRKNFLAGFPDVSVFVLSAFAHVMVYILPFFLSFYFLFHQQYVYSVLSGLLVLWAWFQRLILAKVFGWNPGYALLHPLGVLWYQWLGLVCLWDRFTGKKASWKGREI